MSGSSEEETTGTKDTITEIEKDTETDRYGAEVGGGRKTKKGKDTDKMDIKFKRRESIELRRHYEHPTLQVTKGG